MAVARRTRAAGAGDLNAEAGPSTPKVKLAPKAPGGRKGKQGAVAGPSATLTGKRKRKADDDIPEAEEVALPAKKTKKGRK